MDRKEVLEALAEAAVEVTGVDHDQVTEDARLDEDLDIDSLGLKEFLTAVNDRCGVDIPDERAEGITTIGDVAELVLEHRGRLVTSGVRRVVITVEWEEDTQPDLRC